RNERLQLVAELEQILCVRIYVFEPPRNFHGTCALQSELLEQVPQLVKNGVAEKIFACRQNFC
ncbi:MAG: hypothetical protein J5497_06975, partial [Selenomonadaceae bacterium]|nr:hypothetical protein [Selenomonadaceae bacterium]